jgi:hypothetical protein
VLLAADERDEFRATSMQVLHWLQQQKQLPFDVEVVEV